MKSNHFFRRKFIYLVVAVGLILLAILNFMNWFFLQGLKSDLTAELKNQIVNLGKVSTRLINGNDFEKIFPGMENSTIARYYQQLLYDIKTDNDLENIIILDPTGRLLIDYRLDYRIGDTLFTFPLQRRAFRSAVLGKTPDPVLLEIEQQYFLSAYIPVVNDLLEPVAVLVIDAPMKFFSTLNKFERGTFYLGIAGIGVLILFSLITIFATRRIFAIESRMKEQERLAELGQMAASVAHEIRNPLSIMKGTAEVLKKKYGQVSDEMFSYIPDEIDRLNRLVNDFLQFARQRKLEIVSCDAGKIIEEAVQPLNDSRIHLSLDSRLPKVRADQDALRQILLNIIQNARDAINKHGHINIAASVAGDKSGRVVIEIKDDGKGVPPKELSKIFEPFYSTKAQGSGLGLAISKQLIEQMGGSIEFSSKVGAGSRVRISLSGK